MLDATFFRRVLTREFTEYQWAQRNPLIKLHSCNNIFCNKYTAHSTAPTHFLYQKYSRFNNPTLNAMGYILVCFFCTAKPIMYVCWWWRCLCAVDLVSSETYFGVHETDKTSQPEHQNDVLDRISETLRPNVIK